MRPGDHGPLEAMVREIARQEAAAAVRAALRDAPGPAPRFVSIARHARTSGVGASTLRKWAKLAGVQRQANGKYVAAELEDLVRRGGTPPPTAVPVDIATRRARAAIESLKGGGRRHDPK